MKILGCSILIAPIVALVALPLSPGCAGVRGGAPAAAAPERGSGPVLEADPGPASARPLAPAFEALIGDAGPQGYLRVLLELRRQLDLEALMDSQRRRGLTRGESREETLALLESVSREAEAPVVALLEEMMAEGVVEYYEPLRFRSRVFVSLHPAGLEALRRAEPVAEVIPEYDGVREARREAGSALIQHAPPIPPGDSWGVDLLDLRRLWRAGHDGSGVVIGILDSGVMGDHLALQGARRDGESWYDPTGGSPRPIDTVPHGSQVLSCAVGQEVDGRALGTAPGARWVAALSNLHNSYNNVNMSLAADWLLFEGRPDVLLGAWGHGKASCDPRDRPMVEAFRAAGCVPVFAAGNDGPGPASGQTPAALRGLFPGGRGPLSVAAIDRNEDVIDPSSRGPHPCGASLPFPDVAGPGWNVPVPTGGGPRSLTLASGTSMAVGWVGGVAALVMQVAPEMPVWEVEDLLRETARDIPPAGVDGDSGYGVVDPAAAVEAAREWRAGREPNR